jgi:4-amino-4-deoxy-L-arabinose transferase-like glycosyltransferase
MFDRLHHRAGHYALLLTTSAALFLVNLGGPSLWDIDEGRNATAALEMRESGNWIVPTFNGKLRSHKPALLYWLQAAAYAVCGVNEFAVRLPSALAAMLTVLLVYELGRRMFDPASGLLAGLILASSILFCAAAHFANPDALLLCCCTATLLLLWVGVTENRRWLLAAAGVTAGLAVLAKGPVGIVLPAAVVGCFLVWTGRWRQLFARIWWSAGGLFLLVALPWYVLVTVETRSEFLEEFLTMHNVERALSAMEDHGGPPWYYLVVLLIGLVPWSAFAGSALWFGTWSAIRQPWCRCRPTWEKARDREACFGSDAYRFLACWFLIYLAAFSVAATKLPNYILPAVPPLAILTARFLERWRRSELAFPAWMLSASVIILVGVGGIWTAGLLAAGGVFEFKAFHGRHWPGLAPWALLGSVPILGALAAGWSLWRGRRSEFVTVWTVTALVFLAPLTSAAPAAMDAFKAPRPLVAEAHALQRDQEIRIGCLHLEHLPTLNFYVQRNVQHLDSSNQAWEFLQQSLPAYLFLSKADWNELSTEAAGSGIHYRVVASHREMYRSGEVVVVTNR